ncbi:MAG: hypothetical protein M3512_06155 [Bacteroidota bacterium]|nr:hypothetical protein [Bacteroidota bacterium]
MKKVIKILLFTILNCNFLMAQREVEEGEKLSFKERSYFGGNFNMQFGQVTFIDISPLLGYMVTPRFSIGTGVTYQYLNYRWLGYKTNIYGGRVFARRNIGQQFFAHTEFEALNVEFPKYVSPTDHKWVREWVPGLLVGGGLFQPFGRRGGINLTALYNLTYVRGKSPYASPFIIRAGLVL